MTEPTAADALRFFAAAASQSLKLAQADEFNKALRLLDDLVKADEAKRAIAADVVKTAEKA